MQTIADQEILKHGEDVYNNRCIGCHGAKGDGRGTAAKFLDPKPRDFTSGIFKFKSTPNESLPTDGDLVHTLSKGVLGTSMPSFPSMPEVSRYAVAQYIKSFSDVWKNKENMLAPVQGAPFPLDDFRDHGLFIVRADKGRALYKENCLDCHGMSGRGEGADAQELEDDWGHRIRPASLRKPFIKSGRSVRDIYRVLLTGMAGTPMPSFKDALSDDELWNVSAYILYIRGVEAGVYMDALPLKPITPEEIE